MHVSRWRLKLFWLTGSPTGDDEHAMSAPWPSRLYHNSFDTEITFVAVYLWAASAIKHVWSISKLIKAYMCNCSVELARKVLSGYESQKVMESELQWAMIHLCRFLPDPHNEECARQWISDHPVMASIQDLKWWAIYIPCESSTSAIFTWLIMFLLPLLTFADRKYYTPSLRRFQCLVYINISCV